MLGDDNVIMKQGLAKMLKGGVIMDVVNDDQAIIAERAGAVAIMVLERVPSDIIKYGGVARMCNPEMISKTQSTVKIPVMAKVRIGHSMEAKILQQLKIDFIDESEVLTMTDSIFISKTGFSVPFVCGCKGLDEALRRIEEGASMIRTKGQAGTGNVAEAVKHAKTLQSEIKQLQTLNDLELEMYAKRVNVSFDLVKKVSAIGRLPVVTFAAGGVATPADAALLMQLGMDGVFVGSGIFKSENPEKLAKAIVHSVAYYNEPEIILKASYGTGSAMNGIVLPA